MSIIVDNKINMQTNCYNNINKSNKYRKDKIIILRYKFTSLLGTELLHAVTINSRLAPHAVSTNKKQVYIITPSEETLLLFKIMIKL